MTQPQAEGGCLCGSVRYRVAGTPLSSSVCHCRSCRLASGAPSVAWFVVALEQFELLAGEPASFRSSAQVSRTFCPACGTPLTYRHDDSPDHVELTTATLDDPARFPPTREIWLSHKLVWAASDPRLEHWLGESTRAPGEDAAVPQAIGIDHIYITVSDLARSEPFYDLLLRDILQFRKGGRFHLGPDEHLSYYNRLFGFVLRPARVQQGHEPYAPGLHHFCFRVDSVGEVNEVATRLQAAGIPATSARLYPEYAADYCATFFTDPDGIRLEVTNFRAERRERFAHWADNAV